MRLRELRLTGFKSFVDPVRVPIEAGLTGIVGPNGCGKSNLLESVRWAMGATSAKAMRSSDMDDVIFSGSAVRAAREHAEVVIVLDNAERAAPQGFNDADQLEISRRIRRGMGSNYKINGREVRAKDVQLLFADASTGANSPALVRQGQISELIAAKPENRRRILEEAAGIGGLQARRHEADLKLKATEANLTRLDEVIVEIEGQANSLKKQARQAERYKIVADELRRVEALLMHRRLDDAQVARGAAEAETRAGARAVAQAAENASVAQRVALEAQGRLNPLREEEMIAAAILRKLEGVRVGLERDLKDAQDAIARLEDERARLHSDRERELQLLEDSNQALARLAEEVAALEAQGDDPAALAAAEAKLKDADTARLEAEAKLEAEAAALADRRARAEAATRALHEATGRVARLHERLGAATREREAAAPTADQDKRLADARKAVEAAQAALIAAETASAEAETRVTDAQAAEKSALAPLREAEAKAQTLAAEARALKQLTAQPSAQDFPPALDSLKAKRGYERAVAAALGDDANAALDASAPAHWAGAPEKHTIWSWPAGVAPLSRFVTAPPQLGERIKFCGVIEDANNAAAVMATLTPGALIVSKAGDLWRWDGFVRAASAGSTAGAARLEHANRLEQIEGEIADADKAVSAARKTWEAARDALKASEEARAAARAKVPPARAAHDQARSASQKLEADNERANARRAALDAQIEALTGEHQEAAAQLQGVQAESAKNALPNTIAIDAARIAAQAARETAAEARAAFAALTRERDARAARRDAIARERSSWEARSSGAEARLKDIGKAAEAANVKLAAAIAAPAETQTKLEALANEEGQAEARRADAADKLAAAEARAREADRAVRTAEALHAQEREARAGAQARFEGAHQRVETMIYQIREAIGAEARELPARAGDLMSGPLAAGPISDVERKADRLKAERDSAGPVNLRAVEELAETTERLETLLAEKADVMSAVTKLRRGIGALNHEGRERLMKAFEIVNGHFANLFTTLFEGGFAELRLIQPEEGDGKDPLSSGLEIYCSPPGKKLSTLSLMSGGEQALTAAALIFAVFLANPAPLCVLDEVDAPLDDANVDRFCRMLDEMRKKTDTRFLVITHNPVTMSRMDRLYGVTMAEQGVSQIVSVDLQKAAELAAA